eukprot:gene4125-7411_t
MRRILQTPLKKQNKFVNFVSPQKFFYTTPVLTTEAIEQEYKKVEELKAELKNPDLTESERQRLKLDIKQFEFIFKALLDPSSLKNFNMDDVDVKQNANLGGIFEVPKPRDRGIFFNSVQYVFENNEHKVQFSIGKRSPKLFFLRTKNEHVVIFPNKTSAIAVLSEWEIQTDMIRDDNLPLSLLFGQIEDLKRDELTREKAKNEILKYFEAETICHRELIENPDIIAKYNEVWNPIVEWFNETFETKLKIFDSSELIGDANQIDARNAFKKELDTYDAYQIGLLYSLVKVSDSVVISIAMLKGFLNEEETLQAMCADVLVSIDNDGLVYGEHDILLSQKRMKLSTIALVKALISKDIE